MLRHDTERAGWKHSGLNSRCYQLVRSLISHVCVEGLYAPPIWRRNDLLSKAAGRTSLRRCAVRCICGRFALGTVRDTQQAPFLSIHVVLLAQEGSLARPEHSCNHAPGRRHDRLLIRGVIAAHELVLMYNVRAMVHRCKPLVKSGPGKDESLLFPARASGSPFPVPFEGRADRDGGGGRLRASTPILCISVLPGDPLVTDTTSPLRMF